MSKHIEALDLDAAKINYANLARSIALYLLFLGIGSVALTFMPPVLATVASVTFQYAIAPLALLFIKLFSEQKPLPKPELEKHVSTQPKSMATSFEYSQRNQFPIFVSKVSRYQSDGKAYSGRLFAKSATATSAKSDSDACFIQRPSLRYHGFSRG